MTRSMFVVLLLLLAWIGHCGETAALQVRGDISATGNMALAFLIDSFVDTPTAESLRGKTQSSDPFFILYEGNRFMFEYDPTGTQKPRNLSYKLTKSDVNLISAVSNTLGKNDNDMKTTMAGNALVASEISLSARPDWALNITVTETRNTTLTVQSATNLLREKYNYNASPKPSIFRYCNPNEIVSLPGSAITVRKLLVRMLSKAAEATYKKSTVTNWAVIYMVGRGPAESADAPMNFMVTQVVSR